ncbi:MAG: methanogenesis marker 7 protein, partial [Candidatus Bathyarchaeota archaeon]|nr:methanogenesis marker 7 protein [Candidatus Bathyarchaeota archaeon]
MSETFKYMIFEGGLHKQNILLDFIEDVGGVILQKSVMGLDLIVFFAISLEEIERVEEIAQLLGGKVREAPLVGCEIALVSPSMSRHHLPHPVCDISEYLRRYGAKVNVVGLAQGVGQ